MDECPYYVPYWRPLGLLADRFAEISSTMQERAKVPHRLSDVLMEISESADFKTNQERTVATCEFMMASKYIRAVLSEKLKSDCPSELTDKENALYFGVREYVCMEEDCGEFCRYRGGVPHMAIIGDHLPVFPPTHCPFSGDECKWVRIAPYDETGGDQ